MKFDTSPEFCYNSPLGRVCLPISINPIPLPSEKPDKSNPSSWSILRDHHGEIIRATSCSGSDELNFVNQIERNDKFTTKSFFLSCNGETILTIGGRAYSSSNTKNRQCSKKLSIFAKGDDVDYQLTISQETCSTARIIVESEGSVVEKTVDFLMPTCHKKGTDISLCRALGERKKDQLEPFKELLVLVNNYYWQRAQVEVASLSTDLINPTDGGVQASFWCGLGRAACWGLAGATGAACCVPGALTVVGCIACAGAAGAAGSICSDSIC